MPARVSLFGIEFDPLRMDQAVAQIWAWIASPPPRCAMVVTPNVDHLVLLTRRADFREAYRQASLVLADGMPIVWASRWLGQPLPERVAGSDLVPSIFASASTNNTLKVFLLGAEPGVGQRAAERIQHAWPPVEVVGVSSPPIGFERDDAANAAICDQIAGVKPDVLVVGLGAPKQELWVHTHRDRLAAKVAICAGGTIDFLAGKQQRAPVWMRESGLEWLYRLARQPRRLLARYARDAWVFPQLVARAWWEQRQLHRQMMELASAGRRSW
jgi:N-acetylglucosaminyldiphosphoundecaprenol N-acetyl-beta-D-mannosaminyltransferase